MKENIAYVLLSEEQIQAKNKELAELLSKEYADKNPVFIGVLKGVVLFFSDIVNPNKIRISIKNFLARYIITNIFQIISNLFHFYHLNYNSLI